MDKKLFFTSLGFTEYESLTLSSFLKLKKANAKQLSLDSGVPQNKLYQILKIFEKLSLISHIPSEKKEYKLLNVQTYINKKIEEKETQLKEIKRSSKDIEKIKESEEESVFSLIKGQQAIMDKLAEENFNKKNKEILGVQRNWKIWGGGLRAMQKSIKMGTKVKMIGIINEETKSRALEWKKIGCKIRAYNSKFGENPLRFTIFNGKRMRLTIGKPEIQDPKDYITIWTTSKALINIMRAQFEKMWEESAPF